MGISLRYNRRGVGQSTGRVALWADSDCQDLKAVCAHVAAMQSSSLQGSASSADMRLWVIGYSWGAILAAHTSCFHEVHGVICVSPPAGESLSFATSDQGQDFTRDLTPLQINVHMLSDLVRSFHQSAQKIILRHVLGSSGASSALCQLAFIMVMQGSLQHS